MRRVLLGLLLASLGPGLGQKAAVAQFYQQRSTYPAMALPSVNHISANQQPERRNGFIVQPSMGWGSKPNPPAATPTPKPSPPANQSGDHEHRHHHHHHGSGGFLIWAPGYPFYWSSGFTSPFVNYSPYSIYPGGSAGFNNVPQAVDAPAPAPSSDPVKPKVRTSNAESKAKAGKYIGYGDANFGKQKYLPAVERYKTAAQIAPDLAEAYFRQAYALVALGQYDNAVKAFRRGLKLRSDWSDSPFRLDQIYGNDKIAKTNHLEGLAKAVEANPLDVDPLIALGMQLFFDGQRDRSAVFFSRAAQLGGNEDQLLNDFLPKPGPAGAQKPAADAKIVF